MPTTFEIVPTPAHPAQGPKYVVPGIPSLGQRETRQLPGERVANFKRYSNLAPLKSKVLLSENKRSKQQFGQTDIRLFDMI